MKLQSYKNDPKLKEAFVAEVRKHREADMILQGTYGKQNGTWKGCAVACSLRSLAVLSGEELKTEYDDHAEYEEKLGIPEWLARLEDTLFEGLPKEDAMLWPEQFAEAVPVGVDLGPVKWKFCAYLMKENIERVLALDISEDLKKQVVDAIRGVLAVHEGAIKTGEWDETAASAAWSAARSAEDAAWSAARSARSAAEAARSAARSAAEAAWSAARSAAEEAWSAARSAARSAEEAAWSAAEEAARSAAYQRHSKELLRLISEEK